MTYEEIRAAAKANMKGCRVCSQCDGRGCIGHIPGFGGLRRSRSFLRNIAALNEYGLIMNSLRGIEEPSTETEFFGQKLSMPVMVAPIGAITLNCKVEGEPEQVEKEYDLAVAAGAATAGTLAFAEMAEPLICMKEPWRLQRPVPGE